MPIDLIPSRIFFELRVLPPDQRLHARDPAGIDLDLGFVVKDEFVSLQSALQPGLLGDRGGQVIVHFPRIEQIVVLALFLGAVGGDVGVLQEIREVRTIVRIQADSDARAQVAGLAFEHERPAQGVEDFLGHLHHVARLGEVLDERDEFVAAETSDGVAFPHAHSQTPRSLLEQPVAERVAEGIVDELEAIEIEEQHGHRLAVTLRVVERVGEAVVEHVAVGQSRQGVVRRDVQQVFLGLLAGHELADLAADHAHHLQQRRIWIADLAAEEFEHGEGHVARQDRKGERAVEPGLGGELRPLEAFVAAYVRYPVRRAPHPHLPHQASMGRLERNLAHLGDEVRERLLRDAPGLDAGYGFFPLVHAPARPAVPVERLADGLDDFRDGLGERFRFGEHARHGVFHPLALLGALALGDVARDDDHFRHLAGHVPDDAAFRFDVADAAVLEHEAEFGPLPHARFDRLAEDRLDALAVLGVNLPEGVRVRLDLAVLEDGPVGRTVVDAPALGVDHGDQIADVLGDEAKALFALAQLFLGVAVFGHVAEAPHPAYRLPLDELGPGIAFEDAAVLELDGVETLLAGIRIERIHLVAELLGVFQLIEDEIECVLVLTGGEDPRREAPHLRELLVVGADLAEVVDDQNAVGRGLERRTEERERFPVVDLGRPEAPALLHFPPFYFLLPGLELYPDLVPRQVLLEAKRYNWPHTAVDSNTAHQSGAKT